jgi:hypothetical protein
MQCIAKCVGLFGYVYMLHCKVISVPWMKGGGGKRTGPYVTLINKVIVVELIIVNRIR